MKYIVEVTEMLQRLVKVESSSPNDALNKVRELYRRSDIVLDASDHVETSFDVCEQGV